MPDYDELGQSFVQGKAKPTKCTIQGAVSKTLASITEAKEPIEALKGLFSNPLSILKRANAKQKLAYAKKVDALEAKIDSVKDPTEKAALLDELDELHSNAVEEIASLKVEDLAIKSDTDYQARMLAYMDDSMDNFKNMKFDIEEGKFLQEVLGKENINFDADYIINKLQADIKKAGGVKNYRSLSPEFNKYITAYGEQAVDKIVTVAKIFRNLAKAAGLPEERFLKNYFPKIFQNLAEGAESKMLRDMAKSLGSDPSAKRLQAFFDQKRTGDFEVTENSVHEAVGIYMQGIRRKIKQKYADDIATTILEKAETSGLNVKELEAVKTLVENFTKIDPPDKAAEMIGGTTRAFYRASLMNNIGSALNNLTAIPNLVGSKFGFHNTLQALGNLNVDSSLSRFLDDMNIGSNKDAFSVFDGANSSIDKADPLLKYDLFNKSEQVSIRTAAMAKLIQRYKGVDNVIAVIDKANALKGQAKINSLLKIATEAKAGVMDTIFTNITGNKGKIYSGSSKVMGELLNAGMAFLRHPTREANFVWDLLQNAVSPTTKTQKQAVTELSRYFFAKTMLLGRNAMFFALPAPIMNFIDDKVPQLRETMEDVGMVLEALAIPKKVLGAVNLDFTLGQSLMWWWEPFYDTVSNSSGQSPVPIIRYAQGVTDAWQKVFEGKAEMKHWARAMSALTFVKGGYLEVGGIPIGANQLRKVGELGGSLMEGNMTFWGVDQKLEGFSDYKEAVARSVFSLTPTKSKIILAKSKESGHYRDYLLGIAKIGHMDKNVFKELAQAYGGDTKEAKKSLLSSLARRKKNMKASEYKKAVRKINAYSR